MRLVGDIALDAEVRAIASGAITDGAPVAVNSTGTVSAVAITGNAAGTAVVYDSDISKKNIPIFVPSENKVAVVQNDTANGEGNIHLGTISGTSVSFATQNQFQGSNVSGESWGATICSSNASDLDRVLVAYQDVGNSRYGTAIVYKPSDGSFGSKVVFESAHTDYMAATYDSNSDRVVITYQDKGNSNYGTAVVGTVSGTGVSFGTPVVYNAGASHYQKVAFDSSNNKVVIFYQDGGNSEIMTAIVGTVSGTSISFGSEVAVSSTGSRTGEAGNSMAFDSNANKMVFAWRNNTTQKLEVAVGTVSGTSISFGTTLVTSTSVNMGAAVAFNPDRNKVALAYHDDSNNSYGTVVEGTVSGTSITLGGSMAFNSDGTTNEIGIAYDTNVDKFLVCYENDPDSNNGTANVLTAPFQGSNLTSENYIGIANAAYADGQKATIKTTGSIARDIPPVQIADSLGNAVTYDASQEQSIHNTVIYDPDSQKLLIVYFNNPFSGSDRGHAKVVVGTVDSSNNTISLGTPVTFHADSTLPMQTISAAYDTNADRLVVAFADPNDSHKSKAMVGTVSGTSISFGSEVVFDAGDGSETTGTAMAFDSNTNRIVITYGDSGNSDYSTAIVGTVSGTSISFGTAVVFNSSAHSGDKYNDIVFDSNANKLAIFYRDSGASNHGKVRVATVDSSDNSISFGTETSFNAGTTQYMSAAFDSNANKILVLYNDGGNSDYGTGRVGTISGTDISFGTSTVFQSSGMYGVASTFNSNTNKITMVVRSPSSGIIYDATISGTGVSFSSGFVFNSGTTYIQYPRGIAHDANTNKDIILYRATTAGVAAVIVPASEQFLTIGQQYFVQTDGTLGLSADDPSVIAGTAISGTDIIVKG